MNNNLNYFLAVFLFFALNLQAQITTGALEMKFEDFEMNIPEEQDDVSQEQMAGIFEQMKMTIYFKPEMAVMKMNMMGMMDMSIFYKDGIQTQYMDMMGQKMKIVSNTSEQLDELGISKEKLKDLYKVNRDKMDTKQILDFTCHKTTVRVDLARLSEKLTKQDTPMPEEMKNVEMTFYVTEELQMDGYSYQQLPGFEMKGVPLEMAFDMGPMKMVMKATSFTKNIDASVFNPPAGDYIEMTAEELKKMGMNPNGFGF